MKLIITGPREKREGDPYYTDCCWEFGRLLKAWLAYYKIYIGDNPKNYRVSWNSLYRFYSISLFEMPHSGGIEVEHLEAVPKFLTQQGYHIRVSGTWHWDDTTTPHTRLGGVEIYIEDLPPYTELE